MLGGLEYLSFNSHPNAYAAKWTPDLETVMNGHKAEDALLLWMNAYILGKLDGKSSLLENPADRRTSTNKHSEIGVQREATLRIKK